MTRTSHGAAATALESCAEDLHPDSYPVSDGPCANVLGIAVDALNPEGALARVTRVLRSGRKGYVCAVGVHGILEARRDPMVARAFADAAIVVPDGTPAVWVGRLQKHASMRHVTGPALMRAIFSRDEFACYSHFFYGGKEGVAGELAASMLRQFPSARIAGTYTPPFRPLTLAEESDLVRTINVCKPDMIWVGISTPKQELFMRRMLPRLDTRLMLGVGAAFDFHTGRIKDCAPWVKTAGLHWLHRLLQDPKRLWRRNLGNAAFMWHIALQLTGLKVYPLPVHPSIPQGGSFIPGDPLAVPRPSNQSLSVSRWAWEAAHKVRHICSDD
jgi:N-acetylglucosaminyldiphosphoundecaprenol N-acetyl-beta-D-mannosaminyltransferase